MENANSGSEIIFTDDLAAEVRHLISGYGPGKVFLATEQTVNRLWVQQSNIWEEFPKLILEAGEENKKISSVFEVWEFLSTMGADRKSLIINVGGGMLTDLAGFAASTFKRGMDFINIPTTLLSQVDASVGGKTGFNFNGLKNEIGTFDEPRGVIIYTPFLKTLDQPNFLSGYAEMIKHGLIWNPDHLKELQDFDLQHINYAVLKEMIRHSVDVKNHFVTNDPTEKNIRKALNFGHTVGHALESLALEQQKPMLHGYAVAWGMIAELFLSRERCGFPDSEAERVCKWIKLLYGRSQIKRNDFDRIIALMQHDKKNEAGRINFTLLSGIGQYKIDQDCRDNLIQKALNYLMFC
jgi:3-dehydroquinate synthase